MKVCLDVDYRAACAVAAVVAFDAWTDTKPAFERAIVIAGAPAAYEPGRFYLRELPCLLAALRALARAPSVVVIDGYVALAKGKPGLGARLHEALGGAIPIVGIAKTEFRGATHASRVMRGTSKKPLFVTAAGMSPDDAATAVRSMHGAHRIPMLVARADRLCRDT